MGLGINEGHVVVLVHRKTCDVPLNLDVSIVTVGTYATAGEPRRKTASRQTRPGQLLQER